MPALPIVVQHPALPHTPRPIIIIGAGGIVHNAHLPAYRIAGLPVVGIYDRDPDKAHALAARWDVGQVHPTLAAAVAAAPPDVVYDVAVPASAILDVLAELPDGAAVLIQKPMGEDLAAAHAIRAVCRHRGFVAAINFQLRFAPYILAARSLIDQGTIGTLHDMEVRVNVETPWHLWEFLRGIPRLEILYHSIHYVDLMRSFLGEPAGVYARTVRYPGLDELAATRTTMALDYGDHMRATITTNHHHVWGPDHQESYVKWEGTDGAIKATLGSLIDYPRGIPNVFEYATLMGGAPEPWQPVALEGSWFPHAFIGTMSSLQRYVEGSASTLPTGVEDAFRTMAVVEAAYQSSAHGATPIPADDKATDESNQTRTSDD